LWLVLGFGLEISGSNLLLTCLQDEILSVFAVTSTQTMIPERLQQKKGGLSHADRRLSH
jgi:hypothetical protein